MRTAPVSSVRTNIAQLFGSFPGTLLLFALAFGVANFALIPSHRLRPFPIHADDFRNLATSFATVVAWPARPVSTYGLAVLAMAGAGTYYAALAVLTLLYPALVLWLMADLLEHRVSAMGALFVGLFLFSFPRSAEYPMYTGLITNLLSGTLAVAGMLCLMRGARSERPVSQLASGVLLVAASTFAKEDYVLAPLLFAGFLVWRHRGTRRFHALLAALAGIATADLTLAAYPLVGGRTFTKLTTGGPYTVDLSVRGVLSLFSRYLTLSPYVTAGTVLFATCAAVGFWLLPEWRARITLIVLIVTLLIAPYTILPRHVYEYYVFGWLAWEAALVGLVIAELASRYRRLRGAITAAAAAGAVAAMLLALPSRRALILSYRSDQDRNERIVATLLRNRAALNREPNVAVVGMEGLSPWSLCHAQYLIYRLGLHSRWIVYVPKETVLYPLDENGRRSAGWIAVRLLSELPRDRTIPVLSFDPNGEGTFRYGAPTWTAVAHSPGSRKAVIERVYPDAAEAGSPFQVQPGGSSAIAVKGSGFQPGDKIRWNDRELETSYGSSGLLSALVPADLLARPGTAVVSVANARARFVVLPPHAAERTPGHP